MPQKYIVFFFAIFSGIVQPVTWQQIFDCVQMGAGAVDYEEGARAFKIFDFEDGRDVECMLAENQAVRVPYGCMYGFDGYGWPVVVTYASLVVKFSQCWVYAPAISSEQLMCLRELALFGDPSIVHVFIDTDQTRLKATLSMVTSGIGVLCKSKGESMVFDLFFKKRRLDGRPGAIVPARLLSSNEVVKDKELELLSAFVRDARLVLDLIEDSDCGDCIECDQEAPINNDSFLGRQ